MAIYSCNLASIGRTTHAAGTAGAHVRYIGRDGAAPIVRAHGMPEDAVEARAWMDREEAASRKNARVADKIRIAIPRELSDQERLELVRDFITDLTGNRVPWMFAIHQRGKDAHNPHAHIVVRDRDLETGKRVLRLSDSARDRIKAGLEPKAVNWIRERWEKAANTALERAGLDVRIDRRSLEAQGIDREPTIHIGPRAEHVDRYVQRPSSKPRTNGTGREIDYEVIDQGRTRKERQAEIIDLNLERDTRSPDPKVRALAQFEKQQFKLDRALERQLAEGARLRTIEMRDLKRGFRDEISAVRDRRDHECCAQTARLQGVFGQKREAMRRQHRQERKRLRDRQRTLVARLMRRFDVTGRTRKRHEADRRAMVLRRREKRSALATMRRAEYAHMEAALDREFTPQLTVLESKRSEAIAALRKAHARGEARADQLLQEREAEREVHREYLCMTWDKASQTRLALERDSLNKRNLQR